jgi:hypothetical protein
MLYDTTFEVLDAHFDKSRIYSVTNAERLGMKFSKIMKLGSRWV